MSVLRLTTRIRAPARVCFDLARSIDLHVASTAQTGERAVAGTTAGLLGPGEEVTFRARHFGVWQELTSRITAFDPPRHFHDSMVRGAFARMDHDHWFDDDGDVTVMRDVFDYEAPLGGLGRLVERAVLDRYLRGFLAARNRVLREAAEAAGARPVGV